MNEKIETIKRLKHQIALGEKVTAAASHLYRLGEHEAASEAMLEEFRKYKDLDDPRHAGKSGRFRTTMIGLIGQYRDYRAIPDLLEVLDLYTIDAAYALAKIGGDELEEKLLSIATIDNLKGIGAVITLGYLRHPDVLPQLINLVVNFESIWEVTVKPRLGLKSVYPFQLDDLLLVLGGYDDEEAIQILREKISRNCIMKILVFYALCQLEPEKYKEDGNYKFSGTVGLCNEITLRNGWNKILTKEDVLKLGSEIDISLHTLGPEKNRDRSVQSNIIVDKVEKQIKLGNN